MDTTQLVLDTAERMFADHCDKALLDRAEQGHFAAPLWSVGETLAKAKNPTEEKAILEDLLWALINTKEFMYNH